MANGRPWTDEEVRRAISMRLAGVDMRDIATVLNRGADGVERRLYKLGVKLAPEMRREINRRNAGLLNGANQVPPPRPMDIDRLATISLELEYCAAADRNGWVICGYAA